MTETPWSRCAAPLGVIMNSVILVSVFDCIWGARAKVVRYPSLVVMGVDKRWEGVCLSREGNAAETGRMEASH